MNPLHPKSPASIAVKTATIALLLLATAAFAQSPLAGTWKFNPAKSKLAGDTITFASAPTGGVKITANGQSYTFKPDGSDTTTPIGSTSAWTKVDDSTWKEVDRLGSTPLGTTLYKLSADGKTLTVNSTGKKPNGDAFNDTAVYTRILPGAGFFGKWKSTKVDVAMAGYVFKDNGDGTLLWSLPEYKATVTLKLDGKDYPATGPTVPPGLTLTLTPAGAHKFLMVEKKDSKPIFKATETVSADGKTLTETGSAVGVDEPSTVVYDKQM
jgi:hypothetical protein